MAGNVPRNMFADLIRGFQVSSGSVISFLTLRTLTLEYLSRITIPAYSRELNMYGIFSTDQNFLLRHKTWKINTKLRCQYEIYSEKFIASFGKIKDSFELSFVYGWLKLDIYFFYKDEDYYWNGGTQAHSGLSIGLVILDIGSALHDPCNL
jgi:hypothetical protein